MENKIVGEMVIGGTDEDDKVVAFGKHRGCTFKEVVENHLGWCKWVASLKDPKPTQDELIGYIKQTEAYTTWLAVKGGVNDTDENNTYNYTDIQEKIVTSREELQSIAFDPRHQLIEIEQLSQDVVKVKWRLKDS